MTADEDDHDDTLGWPQMEAVKCDLGPNVVAAAAVANVGPKASSVAQENVIKPAAAVKPSTKSPNKTQKQQQKVQNNNTNLEKTPAASLAQASHEADDKQQEQQQQQQQQKNQQEAKFTASDFELLSKEYQEQKSRTRKLQLEIDEKNEIIIVLKEELETSKEQSDKYQRENLQLVKDAKRAKDLQDELDCLQSKLANVEHLGLENKRLKDKLEEKIKELEYFNIRVGELEKDRNEAQEESQGFEDQCKKAEAKLSKIDELEKELQKWKLFSHELEAERNSIQSKLLESIEQENKLSSINEKVEDEVKRLRSLIKSYEEEKSINIINSSDLNGSLSDTNNQSSLQDTSIKFELDKHIELEVSEENRGLKQKLNEKESELRDAADANKKIRDELESNRKLISDLRQDLACEKSLAQKLTKQLTSFTKQIRHLDKQYFPIHDEENGKPSDKTTTKATDGIKTPNKHVGLTSEEAQSDKSGELAASKLHLAERESKKADTKTGPSAVEIKNKSEISEEAAAESQPASGQVSAARADRDKPKQQRGAVAPAVLPPQTSRQLGELIDQVPHERLTVGLILHQQHSSTSTSVSASASNATTITTSNSSDYPARNQQQLTQPATSASSALALAATSVSEQQQVGSLSGSRVPSQPLMVNRTGDLTEKQIAHLTSLHHQHYYHHLQHMHQLHQMHHLHLHHHRLHHEYQQHQQQQQQQGHTAAAGGSACLTPSSPAKPLLTHPSSTQTGRPTSEAADLARPQLCGPAREPIYSGGSEFYAPAVQQLSNRQLYANAINGGGDGGLNEPPNKHIHHLMHHQHQHRNHPHPHNHRETHININSNNSNGNTGNRLVSNSNNGHSSDNSSSNGGSLRSSPIRQHGARLSPQKISNHSYGLPQIDEVSGLASVQQANELLAAQRKADARKHNSNGLPVSTASAGSSSSSSPTSSSSSRRSPNLSVDSSSSSSASSLSPSGLPLNRGGALRHTTTNVSRRQYSVERNLTDGNIPMTATLSRTGSCRANNIRPVQANHADQDLRALIQATSTTGHLHQQATGYAQMRTPLKSQQPSMRTSKILNISQQQPQQPQQLSAGQVHQLQQQQQQLLQQNSPQMQQLHQQRHQQAASVSQQDGIQNNKSGLSAARSSMERFTSNLANIRLKDSLAFASLRVPKKSAALANGAGHNDSHTSNGSSSAASGKLTAHIVAAALARGSPERRRQVNLSAAAAAAATNDNNNNIRSNTSNGASNNKSSSVFFEYGCV